MVTPEQYETVSERGRWARKVEDAISRAAAELVELAKEDYAHQIGPRQLTGMFSYKAYQEVSDELWRSGDAIRQRAQHGFMVWYAEHGQKG